MNTLQMPQPARLIGITLPWVTALLLFSHLENADHALAQAPAGRSQSESGTSLKSRVQSFKESADSLHERVYRLFEPFGNSAAENQIPSILMQVGQNRERWAKEIGTFIQAGENISLTERITKVKASIASEGGDEDDAKLLVTLAEYLKSVETSKRQLETDRVLLEKEAKTILATADVLAQRITLLTGQEDANAMVLRFVRNRVAQGGFATVPERRPATESRAATNPIMVPQKNAPAEALPSTILQGRQRTPPPEAPQKKEVSNQGPPPSPQQAPPSLPAYSPPSIETAARSFFAAVENRNLERLSSAMDDPVHYYQNGTIPLAKVISEIQSDWRRYRNWHGAISQFHSTDPFSCTFTLNYSLLEGDRHRAASLKLGLTLNPKWPHRITKIYSTSARSDPPPVPSPVTPRERAGPEETETPLPRKEYRVNVTTSHPQVLLKKKPDINSETVTVVPKTISGIVAIGDPTGRDKDWLPVRIGNLSGFYIQTEDLCLMGAPRFAVITPGPVEDSWNDAVAKYPNLAIPGSSAQENFSTRVQAARFKGPELLSKPGWPLSIANQLFSAEQNPQAASTAAAIPEWTTDTALKALDQAMESAYQSLLVQFGASPLVGRLRAEQAEWFDKRKTVVSSQPKELQSAVALQMTSERANRLGGLQNMAKRPGEPWKTYAAGAAPRGKILSVDQAAEMADFGNVSPPTYLVGSFIVTALDRNHVVLRAFNGARIHTVRVVVEFPPGQPLPGQGFILTRGNDRGFLIREIRREADGSKSILAKEIVRT